MNVLQVLLDPHRRPTVASYERTIVTVRGDEPAYDVLRRLRALQVNLAAVSDPEGRSVGLVTPNDIVDRLVRSALG